MPKRIIFQIQIYQLAEDVDDDHQLVDLLEEDVHDLSLMHMPQKLQLKYQHTYECGAYGAWPT